MYTRQLLLEPGLVILELYRASWEIQFMRWNEGEYQSRSRRSVFSLRARHDGADPDRKLSEQKTADHGESLKSSRRQKTAVFAVLGAWIFLLAYFVDISLAAVFVIALLILGGLLDWIGQNPRGKIGELLRDVEGFLLGGFLAYILILWFKLLWT